MINPPCAASKKFGILIPQTTTQIIEIIFANYSPNSSNYFFNGESSVSVAASYT